MMLRRSFVGLLIGCLGTLAVGNGLCSETPRSEKPFNFEEASRDVPKPRELLPLVQRDMIPMNLKVLSDEIVTSDTDPSKRLRKITAHFDSLELEGKKWGHPCVVFTPADNSINQTPQR